MRRRRFIESLLAAGSAPAAWAQNAAPDPAIKRVLVMFKCHLDVGFVNTQANVVKRYFDQHFPRAIETAATARREGKDRFVWTTGSWLIYQYLEAADPPARKRMEEALAAGDIAWHALPFSWQSEMLEPSMISGAIGFSRALDRRFHRTTTGAKMTDVPGHTRALIAPLAEGGVKLLDVGVNSASTPPDVPEIFLWKDAAGRSVIVMYHLHRYGGVVKIPGSDLAIDIEVRNDNAGPNPLSELRKIYADLRKQFPNAQVIASSLADIANAVEPYRAQLPVVTQEIGDTWIYGVPSDPLKVARYCEVARLRKSWVAAGKLQPGDATDLALLRDLLLEVEHTWGTDTKKWLDFDHYTPHDVAAMLNQPKWQVVTSSWEEKRQDLFDAVKTLPAPLRDEALDHVRQIAAVAPKSDGLRPLKPGEAIEAKHFTIALDAKTGAISRLRSKASGRDWASEGHPLALFSYQTLSKSDYDRFFAAYIKRKADWVPKDFGKPNIEKFGAQSRTWTASLVESRHSSDAGGHRLVAELKIDDQPKPITGWPSKMYIEVELPDAEPVVNVRFSWFGKAANRMPEALWLTFQPVFSDAHGWMLGKSGSEVSPFDVVTGGNRAMHAVLDGLRYQGREGTLRIESLDAPVVSLGERMPVYFTREQPELAKGFHFSLFNNGWGTNYVQWFGEDMSFRFRIAAG